MKKRIIALIGNPNAGKTTLFNQLTGKRQRVGNWAGVTVERKEGLFTTKEQQVILIDLPGTYSLTALSGQASPDERITRDYLLNQRPDMIINVVDAANLERNLYLTMQLLELGIPCILALNMLDIARRQRIRINLPALSRRLGCPVVSLVSVSGRGLGALKQAIDRPFVLPTAPPVSYPSAVTAAIDALAPWIGPLPTGRHTYWQALQLLEGDNCEWSRPEASLKEQQNIRAGLARTVGEDPALIIADARYRAIGEICEAVSNGHQADTSVMTRRLDALILNRWLGIPIFFLVMYLMFILSINVGGAFKPLFELGSAALFIDGAQWLGHVLNLPVWLTRLLSQGVGCGINTLLPLIPQIGLMYLFLSLLEDTGYMARAAFVMDRLMRALGLPGKSFVPLIVGFGCNVPAVMATRTLDTQRERLMTMMMAPFMSCGARLAIFAVFAAAFFEQNGASIVFSLYMLGIVVAILTGLLLKHTVMRGEAPPFIMELPVYHTPHARSLLLQSWQRLKLFILRAGKVIIAASIMIGLLSGFTLRGTAADSVNASALASVGKAATPLLAPLGVQPDNWQATVGLLSGVLAKEVVVGTLNQLYTAESLDGEIFDPAGFDLPAQLTEAVTETGRQLLSLFSLEMLANPIDASKGDGEMNSGAMGAMAGKFGGAAAAYGYLIFVLLYVPCISVMGAIARESHRKWMALSVLWSITAAYSVSTLFYQAATFSIHPASSLAVILLVFAANTLLIGALYLLRHRWSANPEPSGAAGPCPMPGIRYPQGSE